MLPPCLATVDTSGCWLRPCIFAGLETQRRAATVAMAAEGRSQGAYIGDVKVAGSSAGPLHGLTAVVKVRF